jgi:hypothetical protein
LPWERDRIPLIFVEGQLIGVVGYVIATDFVAQSEEVGRDIWLATQGSPPLRSSELALL